MVLPKAVLYKGPHQIEKQSNHQNTLDSQTQNQTQIKSNCKLSLQKFFSPKSLRINYGYSSISPEITNIKLNKFNTLDFNDYTEIVINHSKMTPSKDLALLIENSYQNSPNYHTMTEFNDFPNKKSNIKPAIKRKVINDVTNTKIDLILKEYSQKCNYLLFLKQCSLSIFSSSKNDYYNMKLISFFTVFTPLSLFGLDVDYVLIDNDSTIEDIQKVTYFPTLSSLTISITDPDIIEPILKEITNKKIRQSLSDKTPSVQSIGLAEDLDNENKTNCSEAYTEYIIIEGLKIIVGQDSIKIEFIESKPPYVRNLFHSQIAKCFNSLKAFELIDMEKVINNSWFCVSWNPHSINKDQRLQITIFLAYYQFKLSSDDLNINIPNGVYRTIPPIGILPIKYDERQWLSPFCNVNENENEVKEYDHLITRAMVS